MTTKTVMKEYAMTYLSNALASRSVSNKKIDMNMWNKAMLYLNGNYEVKNQ